MHALDLSLACISACTVRIDLGFFMQFDCGVNAAYIYWRMLSRNPEATRKIVFATKPTMNAEIDSIDSQTLATLIGRSLRPCLPLGVAPLPLPVE